MDGRRRACRATDGVLPAGNQISRQTEPFVVTSVDVAHQFIHVRVVALRCQLNRFLERVTAGQ